ncbi:hypothetical protein QTL97_09230 [Sporosarcina thermotolerans]|uniref:Tissue inhibitor of metalloproteinase n=1 Tax=Sporosarcina thermotolerans TaxID=633404 RepID=A0AAW9A6Y5_9BACL|nr:hypothetical protein [Sporosarcina thermotolerans]MDW0117117.1 hypothetical protein [Sporosarcina thermotolerans]WHT47794.1 hypothetical protein QNH10_17075 [Sporosarcina thermotolerans]
MKVRYLLSFGLLFILFLWWKPLDASACSCVALPPPKKALTEADAVFSGEVVEIIENGKHIVRGKGKTIHFKVDEVWKGIDESEAVVTTGLDTEGCGFPFEKGKKYLVYASMGDMYVANTLTTTICRRTTEFAYATEDLTVLGEGQEVSSLKEDKGETTLPIWPFVLFILGLVAIFIGFRYKKSQKNACR